MLSAMHWHSNGGQRFRTLLLTAALSLLSLGAVAQPSVGQRFTDSVSTEAGYRIPLPPGDWEARAMKIEEQPKNVTRHLVLRNADPAAAIPYLVVRYATKQYSESWRDACATKSPTFWRSRHGSQPNLLLQKCQLMWVDSIPRESQTQRDKWTWANLFSGFADAAPAILSDQLVRTAVGVAMDRGDFASVDLFARPSLAGLSASSIRGAISGGQNNAWTTEFLSWTATYIEALKSSVIDKRYVGLSAFNPPNATSFAASVTNTAAANPVAAGQGQPNDQQVNTDLQAGLRQDATRRANEEEARRREQDAFEQSRLEAARRLEEAEEARRREAQEEALVAQQAQQAQQAQAERDRTAREQQQRLLAEEQQRQRIQREKEALAQKAAQEQAERERLQAEVARLRAQIDQDKAQASGAVSVQAHRKALVIGNDSYRHTSRLVTAREDAKIMSETLRRAGFSVTTLLDTGEKEMRATLRRFSSQVQGGDEVVFFYAGHGVQLGGINYLIPVDVPGESEAQLRDDAIPLQRILDDMTERKAKLTVAVIDACRDNPFQVAGRSLGGNTRGLAATTAATGQMIIFSAGSGQRALDNLGPSDKSPNGVFTRVFVQEMSKRGVSIDRMVRNARGEVVRLAQSIGHDQVPAIYDQVIGEFYLVK